MACERCRTALVSKGGHIQFDLKYLCSCGALARAHLRVIGHNILMNSKTILRQLNLNYIVSVQKSLASFLMTYTMVTIIAQPAFMLGNLCPLEALFCQMSVPGFWIKTSYGCPFSRNQIDIQSSASS